MAWWARLVVVVVVWAREDASRSGRVETLTPALLTLLLNG